MKNINFLLRAFQSQLPSSINTKIIELKEGYILEIYNPDERFNNHFSNYYIDGTTNILIRDDGYKILLELSKVSKRYFDY